MSTIVNVAVRYIVYMVDMEILYRYTTQYVLWNTFHKFPIKLEIYENHNNNN